MSEVFAEREQQEAILTELVRSAASIKTEDPKYREKVSGLRVRLFRLVSNHTHLADCLMSLDPQSAVAAGKASLGAHQLDQKVDQEMLDRMTPMQQLLLMRLFASNRQPVKMADAIRFIYGQDAGEEELTDFFEVLQSTGHAIKALGIITYDAGEIQLVLKEDFPTEA